MGDLVVKISARSVFMAVAAEVEHLERAVLADPFRHRLQAALTLYGVDLASLDALNRYLYEDPGSPILARLNALGVLEKPAVRFSFVFAPQFPGVLKVRAETPRQFTETLLEQSNPGLARIKPGETLDELDRAPFREIKRTETKPIWHEFSIEFRALLDAVDAVIRPALEQAPAPLKVGADIAHLLDSRIMG